MHRTRVLIAGCGDVGTALGLKLARTGAHVRGLRRTINQLPAAIQPIAADLSRADGIPPLSPCDYLIYTAAAKSRDPAVYRAVYVDGLRRVLDALPTPPRRLILTSSSSVYGQHRHEWVDEFSPTRPVSETGRILLASEQIAATAGCPASIVRFSGIYGPGREHLLNQVRAGVVAPTAPIHYSNRIHRDDCVGILTHLLQQDAAGGSLSPLYLASDDHPAPIGEITQWLAQRLGVAGRIEQPMGRGGSKKCSNRRIRASGYRFRYPDFRAGFTALLEK